MEKTGRIATILTLAVAFCFVLASVEQAECLTDQQTATFLPNTYKTVSKPIWMITKSGSALSVNWVDHTPNPRFAIYDSGTPGDNTDDIVLDKETGLVWQKNVSSDIVTWEAAQIYCNNLSLGGRMGWRLPTVQELASLVDKTQSYPALPSGHPFTNVTPYAVYWSATTYADYTINAWCVGMPNGLVGSYSKPGAPVSVWCVRGGQGVDPQ